jgi:stringent starvation protein B
VVPTKPYLVRAIYQWCVDQGFTPYLAVVVGERTRVPRQYVKDGQIVLNIGPEATQQLLMGDEEITFQARFSGNAFPVVVPVDAVSAIYARENGQGMAFEVAPGVAVAAEGSVEAEPAPAPEPPETPPQRPRLTRIK